MDENKHFIIIDGNSLLFRAYFATSYGDETAIMRTSKGIPTNAIFAFANMLIKILSTMNENDGIFVGFDKDSQTFRKQEFEQYKANRKPCPEPLKEQFPISRELLNSLGIVHYEEHGIEADDICGTMAKLASSQGYKVDIYTSDKDYLQLIDENICINLIKTGLSNTDIVNQDNMKSKYGFDPMQIIDFKGLRGDSSDNLPGIPGVGDITAVKFIQEFGSFNNIIEAAKSGKIKGKIAQKIIDNEDLGRQCYNLATIKIDAKLPYSPEDCLYKGFDFETVKAFAAAYELRSFASRIPLKFKIENGVTEVMPELQIVTKLPNLSKVKEIGLALDIDYSVYHTDTLEGLSIFDGKNLYYISKGFLKESGVLELIKNPNIKKSVFDSKCVNYVFRREGIEINDIDFDIMLASYLIDSNLSSSPKSIYQFHGVELPEEEAIDLFSTPSKDKQIGTMAYYALKLKEKILGELKNNESLNLFNNIELPLASILAKMEFEGFPLDENILSDIGQTFKEKRDIVEEKILSQTDYKFNISSPKQVMEFLKVKRGHSDITSTSVEVLEEIGKTDPIALDILEYRKYAKLVSTYIDGMIPHISGDGKVHTYFNQALTATGRLSSSNPNLQNISARDEEGKQIRKAFFYKDDTQILSLDYGQIELRILAALANCKSYIDVFNNGHDVHTETAKALFRINQDDSNLHSLRRKAKAINFAIIYGTTPYGLAEQIGCSPKEAADVIANFYRTYPEIANFLNKTISQVEKQGYVKTMFGRRRYIKEISDPSFAKREAAKRQALNAPVQGSAADLIKIAMIKVDEFLQKNQYKTKMVLQIHDELLFAVPKEEQDIILPLIKEIMEHAIEIQVKLIVEGTIAKTWYDAKE